MQILSVIGAVALFGNIALAAQEQVEQRSRVSIYLINAFQASQLMSIRILNGWIFSVSAIIQ